MRRLAVPMLLTLLAVAALAAGPSPAEPGPAMARLQSPVPSEVAWGAYLAGEKDIEQAVPLLVAQLAPRPGRDAKEWGYAYRAVLDALIRLDARVPGEILAPHLRGNSATLAFILAAREPVRNRLLLLDLFDRWARPGEKVGIAGVAVGNALSQARSPGFAVRILPRIEMTLRLDVHDPGDDRSGPLGMCSIYGGSADGIVRIGEGYPPYAVYHLVPAPKIPSPTTLVAGGTRPVHYRRLERKRTRFGTGSVMHLYAASTIVREWLADLLRLKLDALGLPAHVNRAHGFTDAETYREWAVTERDAILRRHASIIEGLVARRLLTPEEARGTAPRLTVEIEDGRKDRSVPLPALPPTTVKPDLPADAEKNGK